MLVAALGILTIVTAASASTLDAAVAKAGLRASDPIEIKIEKTLSLLVDRRYFEPHGVPDDLPPPFDEKYHIDSLRTAEEILAQKIGGYCNSYALAFAAMLHRAGVPADDIRVVAAVNDRDLALICPEAGAPRSEHPRSGASGHVFVAVKHPSGIWRLINTVGRAKMHDQAVWPEPAVVEAWMRQAPLAVPSAATRSGSYQPMTIFAVWREGEQPLHTFEQRFNLIASGTIHGKVCRYGPPAVGASESDRRP